MPVINLDAPQYSAEKTEVRPGVDHNPARSLVDMSSPETRDIFRQNSEQGPGVVPESGQLSFDTADIYGGSNSIRIAPHFGIEGRGDSVNGSQSETPTAFGAPATTAENLGNSSLASSDYSGNGLGASTIDAGGPAPATTLESTSAQVTAGIEAPSVSATAADLAPEQAAIAQSTVQLATPVVNVGPNGELTESTSTGTGFLFTGADGQQYIGTAGHVVAATGQDNVNGQTTYAEGPTQVTLPDGTQTTATVLANNTSMTSDNSVQTGNPADVAVLSMAYPGPILPSPSLPLDSSATPSQGDTLNTAGYVDGQLTGISSPYLGLVTPEQVANNTDNTSPMLEMAGSGVHGMSGAPVVNADGNVVGVYTEGTNPTDGTNGVTLDTPISTISTLNQGLTTFGPNFLYNIMNGKPQPIATPDDPGNGSDQSLTGVTLNNGTSTTYLEQPATTAPATSTDAPATATPAAPVDAPAAPVDAPAVPAPAPTVNDTVAPPTVQTGMDVPAADTATLSASDTVYSDAVSPAMADMGSVGFGMGDMGGFGGADMSEQFD
jgi:hypothetical protein